VGGEGFAVDASLIAADANKQRSVPGDEWRAGDADPGRAVREYLATSTMPPSALPARLPRSSSRHPIRPRSGPASTRAMPSSPTPPTLLDTEHAVILDVEARRAIRQAEVGASRTMLDRTAERFGLTPQSLVADSAYGSAENLAWLVKQRGIVPHIGVRQVQPDRWHAIEKRLCLRSRAGSLHLSRGQASGAVPPHLRHAALRHHQGGDAHLSRQQA
jgi:hypothetical protein